jgi:head-tail adaptor
MRAGRLDRLVTIQRKTSEISEGGSVTNTWETVVLRRPASLAPVRGEERFSDPAHLAEQQVEFRVHYSKDVAEMSPLWRIINPALEEGSPEPIPAGHTIYDVAAVHEVGRHEALQIIAVRRPDSLS